MSAFTALLEASVIVLSRQIVRVIVPPEEGTEPDVWQSRLRAVPAVREAIGHFMLALADATRSTATGHVCTRCGECCKRPVIEVTGQDVFRIARHLGYEDDAKFREDYLEPAPTWSTWDGRMKKTAAGACVFLKTDAEPSTTRCSIYDVRPQSCRDYPATMPACIKPPGKLIEHLKMVMIKPQGIEVTNERDEITTVPRDMPELQPTLKALIAALPEAMAEDADQEPVQPLRTMIEKLKTVIHHSEMDFEYFTPEARIERVRELRRCVLALEDMADMRMESKAPIQPLWPPVLRLEKVVQGGLSMDELVRELKPELPPVLPAGWDGAVLYAHGVRIEQGTQVQERSWTDCPAGQSAAQKLLQTLVTFELPALQEALQEKDPPCFLCGQCCRTYNVELGPYDIDMLADHLHKTAAEVIRDHTTAGGLSWNPHTQFLSKKDEVTRDCQFLEQREDKLYYCTIYEARPFVCRQFQPTEQLCRTSNQLKLWPRMLTNLVYVRLSPRQIAVQTRRLEAEGKPPVELPYSQVPGLLAALEPLLAALTH